PMGRLLLVSRLAVRDLRRRPVEAGLLLLAIMRATTTLTLGLALHGVTDKPYQKTREATAGPDVVASADATPPELGGQPANLTGLKSLARDSGVTRYSGPFPVAWTTLTADGETVNVRAEGRDTAPATVDQPKLTEGSWVRDGGAVVEAAFAYALGIGAGDRITLNGRTFRVVGVAITAATAPYPESCLGFCGPSPGDAGLVWLTRADARSLAPDARSLSYVSYPRLAHPAAAPALPAQHRTPPPHPRRARPHPPRRPRSCSLGRASASRVLSWSQPSGESC